MTCPKYNLGDEVWIAWASAHHEETRPCDACQGDLVIRVLRHGGEILEVTCDYCTNGAGTPPSGTRRVRFAKCGAVRSEITGITKHLDEFSYEVTPRPPGALPGYHNSEEEALAAAAEKMPDLVAQAHITRAGVLQNDLSKVGFSIAYHRKQLRSALRSAAYHRGQVTTLKERTKK